MLSLQTTEDGSHTIQSTSFNATYHSLHGAIQETKTVFIDAALHYKAKTNPELSILDVGLGTGLNAWMTFLVAQKFGYKIRYVGMEGFPLEMNLVEQLNYPSLLNAENRRDIFLNIHRYSNQWVNLSDNFLFYKKVALFDTISEQEEYDVIYYDAFAPTAQPELWEVAQFQRIYNALRPNGILTTYCAKGVVKRALREVGFKVESLPGPIGKREMTRAVK